MKGLLVVNAGLLNPKFNEIHDLFLDAFQKRNIVLEKKTNTQLLCSVSEPLVGYDFCIFYDKDEMLCRHIEQSGIRCFNSSSAIAVCDDKAKMALQLAGRVKMPKQVIAPLLFFGTLSEDYLLQVEEYLVFPIVVKSTKGSFGEQILLAKNHLELISLCKRAGTRSLLFQEYLDVNGEDIRLYVIHGEVVAGLKRKAQTGEFRANLSIGGSMSVYQPNESEKQLAILACRILGVEFGGVDLLQGEEPVLLEVNSNAHFKNLLDCTGFSFASAVAGYVEREMK